MDEQSTNEQTTTDAPLTGTKAEYVALKRMIDDCQPDVDKAVNGNKAAGTRVRKVMQDVKKKAQAIRVAILQPAS